MRVNTPKKPQEPDVAPPTRREALVRLGTMAGVLGAAAAGARLVRDKGGFDVVQSSGCIARRFGAWPLMVCFDVGLYDGRSLRPGTGDLIPTLGISEGISVGLGGVGTGASGEGKDAR